MPFQSEKQRKYLWANEPEIARDWTDTYGSGIKAAQGGRIGFYRGSPHSNDRGPGPGGQSSASNRGRDPGPGVGGQSGDRGGSLSTGSPHSGSWSGPTYSKPETVKFEGPNIHREGIGSQTFNKNLRTLALQNQYRQGAYQRAHPFLSKVKSGLGSLGRGIGHVARNFNPLSLAFDNPYMKLLMSGYGRDNMKNLLQRNNQDQDSAISRDWERESKDFDWENVNYNPNALTRLQMEQDILPEEEALRDEMFTEIPTMAAHGGLIGSVGGISRPKYREGNMVGAEIEGAEIEGAEIEGAEMQSQEVIKELYDAFIAQGLSPQEAIEKIKQMIAGAQAEEPEGAMMGEEFPGQEFGRAPAAFGGIMDTYTGRRKYGLGSFIKKAFKKIKKIAKSPIGKAALAAGAMYLTRNMGPIGKAGGWKKYLFGAPGSTAASGKIGSLVGGAPAQWTGKSLAPGILGKGGPMGKFALTQGGGSMMPTALGIGTAATLTPFAMQAMGKWKQDQLPGGDMAGQKFDFNYGQMRKDIADAVSGGDYNEFTEVLGNYGLTEGANIPNWGTLAHGAEGGRVGMQSGGDTPEVLGPVTPGKGITDIDTGDFNLSDLGEYTQMYGPEGAGGLTLKELIKFLMTKGFSLQASIAKAVEIAKGGMEGLSQDDTGRDEITDLLEQPGERPGPDWDRQPWPKLPRPERRWPALPESEWDEGDWVRPAPMPEWKPPKDWRGDNMPEWQPPKDWPGDPGIRVPPRRLPEDWRNRLKEYFEERDSRPMAAEGGLMNLGGMEKDYRQEGGFVPLGGEEKSGRCSRKIK